ncbi:hypothetical protein [Metabacillus sediminilitoris]|nr:hypothetical protein [Metabacillus sediminilitoris]
MVRLILVGAVQGASAFLCLAPAPWLQSTGSASADDATGRRGFDCLES